MKSIKVSTKY